MDPSIRERLGLKRGSRIRFRVDAHGRLQGEPILYDLEDLWAMADQARVSAGHLILQVHPERFHLFSDALRSVMEKVTEEGGWKASLAEVASWILAGKGGPGHWPGGRPYALSVTGDLDAVSLADFASRVLVT